MKINQLDGIRGIAVLFVFCTHMVVWNTTNFGQIVNLGKAGVYIFFVLSSYFMFSQFLTRDLLKKSELKKFYIARFFRVYPLYFLAITIVTLFYYISGSNIGFLTYLYNIIFLQGVTQFTDIVIITLSWTLVVEIQLYIFVPILGIIFFGKKKQYSERRVLITLLFTFITSIFFRYIFTEVVQLENFFFLFFDLFTIGALVAYKHNNLKEVKHSKKYISILILFLFVVCSIITSPTLFPNEIRYLFILPMYSVMLYVLFDYLLFRKENIIQNICKFNVFVKIGIYGYSIYLMHGVVRLFNDLVLNSYNIDMGIISMSLVSIGLSIVTYNVIEVPFQKIGKKIVARCN